MRTEQLPDKLVVDFLFLDRSVCTRCQGTDAALEQALQQLQPILDSLGVEVELRPVQVMSPEQALELGFVTSPTVRINGRDVQPAAEESECESCGDLCGDTVDCRVWSFRGQSYNAPPAALFVDAILRALYGGGSGHGETPETAGGDNLTQTLPDNLLRFFAGPGQAPGCCGPCDCGGPDAPTNCV